MKQNKKIWVGKTIKSIDIVLENGAKVSISIVPAPTSAEVKPDPTVPKIKPIYLTEGWDPKEL